MNQRAIVIILVILVVLFAGTTIYFAITKTAAPMPVAVPITQNIDQTPLPSPSQNQIKSENNSIQLADKTSESKKYTFSNVDDFNKKPFDLLYPPDATIVKDKTTGITADKLVYKVSGKECGLIILPGTGGIEGNQGSGFSSSDNNININGQEWENLIWKSNGKEILYNFKNVSDSMYSFQASTENLTECLNSYKQILSTFKFTK